MFNFDIFSRKSYGLDMQPSGNGDLDSFGGLLKGLNSLWKMSLLLPQNASIQALPIFFISSL